MSPAFAKAAANRLALAEATGQTDAEWWIAHAAHLARLVDPARFPLAVRVGAAAGAAYGGPTDPARTFEFGLARLIRGIEEYIECRTKRSKRLR